MLNLYSNTRKDGIFMNRRANSSYFHEAVDDGIIMARSRIRDLGSCNPESIEQRQIDDFQDLTSVILKVINLALFLSDEAKFHERQTFHGNSVMSRVMSQTVCKTAQ